MPSTFPVSNRRSFTPRPQLAIIFVVTAMACSWPQTVDAGTIIIAGNGIEFADDIGQPLAPVFAGTAAGQLNGDSVNHQDQFEVAVSSFSDYMPYARASASTASILGSLHGYSFAQTFRANATVGGVAVAGTEAYGGNAVVADLRGYDGPLSGNMMTAFFHADGLLLVDRPLVTDWAWAQVSWGAQDFKNGGVGFTRDLAATSLFDYLVVSESLALNLNLSWAWLGSEGTTTSQPQGDRRPDFGLFGYTDRLVTQAQAGGEGSATANFLQTAKLTSILLSDGTTPESQGIDLYFLSGQRSPNLGPAEVPEPTSLTLFGLGALGLVHVARRRRQIA